MYMSFDHILYFVICILYSVFCILYSVFYILYSVFCILYSVFCILYYVFCDFYVQVKGLTVYLASTIINGLKKLLFSRNNGSKMLRQVFNVSAQAIWHGLGHLDSSTALYFSMFYRASKNSVHKPTVNLKK